MTFPRVSSVVVPTLFLALGCGGDASGNADDERTGHLAPEAVTELEDLGVRDYQGVAVATGEESQADGVVRVSYDPDSGPICLRGDPFAAFYVDRGSDKVMILLDGGGACWTGFCFADETADAAVAPFAIASMDAANYFRDWNLVFVPYCDGSVFSGDNDVDEPDGTVRYHHGRQNLATGFDLALEHFPDATEVLIGGFSAGGYGTLPGMIAARLAYPNADLFVMDDSGPGLQNLELPAEIEARITDWKHNEVVPASCTECEGGRGQLSQLFTWMLERDDNVKIALISYFEDAVIGQTFLKLTGPGYKELLTNETTPIHAAHAGRFQRYMLPGASHVVSGGWGTVTADGVPLDDWMAAMATGDAAAWKDVLAQGP